jgi:hypothetical protein
MIILFIFFVYVEIFLQFLNFIFLPNVYLIHLFFNAVFNALYKDKKKFFFIKISF